MSAPLEHIFEETGAKTTYEPENNLIFLDAPKGPFDKAVLANEIGWFAFQIESLAEASAAKPVHVLICGKNLEERTVVPFLISKKLIDALRNKNVGKIAFCCTPPRLHGIITMVRMMTGSEVENLEEEQDARIWLKEGV